MSKNNTDYKRLPLEEQVRIAKKMGEPETTYDLFLVTRALYIAEARLNGKDDEAIAREITVEYRDSGQHMRQIRASLDIN